MELYVNDRPLDVTIENETTVGDVLRSFATACEQEEAATIAIKLNGKDIDESAFDSILDVPLEDSTKINLTVVSAKEIDDAFAAIAKNMDAMAVELQEVPVLLQSKPKDAQSAIKKLADEIDFLCHTATLSALFPQRYGKINVEGKTLNEFFSDLLPILEDLQKAMGDSDSVTIGDLSQYEISPRLKAMAVALGELKGQAALGELKGQTD